MHKSMGIHIDENGNEIEEELKPLTC